MIQMPSFSHRSLKETSQWEEFGADYGLSERNPIWFYAREIFCILLLIYCFYLIKQHSSSTCFNACIAMVAFLCCFHAACLLYWIHLSYLESCRLFGVAFGTCIGSYALVLMVLCLFVYHSVCANCSFFPYGCWGTFWFTCIGPLLLVALKKYLFLLRILLNCVYKDMYAAKIVRIFHLNDFIFSGMSWIRYKLLKTHSEWLF